MEIFENEHDRLLGTLGGEPILERSAHLVAHEDVVMARRAQLHVVVVGKGDAEDFGKKLCHARPVVRGNVSAHARSDLLALNARRLAVLGIGRGAKNLSEHAEGRARAHRVAAARPHLVCVTAVP